MILALLLQSAQAESWCAEPLVAHEWGVTVLLPEGGTLDTPAVPAWMHRSGAVGPAGAATRTLPRDHGERDLPVLSFFSTDQGGDQIPLGIEVGFTQGEATVWFPAVDVLKPPSTKSHQLQWDALLLTTSPLAALHEPLPWVVEARAVEGALWVNRPGETERFVFYEGETQETPAIAVSALPHGFRFENTSRFDVHDVAFLQGERAWVAERVPPGASVDVASAIPRSALRRTLDRRWTTDRASVLTSDWRNACVMMRDPAVPVSVAGDHRLFADELAVLWSAWEIRLLDGGEQRLLYREDPAALDSVMPLSIYTDMFHDPSLSRLGLVTVESPVVRR